MITGKGRGEGSRIGRFFLTYESEVTKRNYRLMLTKYFKVFYDEGTLEEQANKYFEEGRDYEEDVRTYFSTIISSPPKSVEVQMSMARTFLADNDVEFPSRFWKELRRKKKGHGAVTQDKIPTQEELRHIVMQLPLSGRAFFLTLASSGMRIGEALKLTDEDIDFNVVPAIIRLRAEYTKSGNQRVTFISNEAKEYLTEFLKVKRRDSDKLFPLTYRNMIKQWDMALEKSQMNGKDKTTHWNFYHVHTLRKFFRTQLATAINVDIVEVLMGHSTGQQGSYRRYSEGQLIEEYRKGMHAVSVSIIIKNDTAKLSEIERKNEELRIKVEELTLSHDATRRELHESQERNLAFDNANSTLKNVLSPEEFKEYQQLQKQLTMSFLQKKMFPTQEALIAEATN
jgi:integrase